MYLVLIALSISNATRPPPLRVTRKCDDRAHISRAKNQFVSRSRSIRIIYSFVTLLISKSKCELSRRSIAYYRRIFVIYVLGIRVSRVRENCLTFRRDLPVSAIYFFSNSEKSLDIVPCANYLCMHLNECINYRSTSFTYCPLWIHLQSISTIKFKFVQQRESLLLQVALTSELFIQGDTSVTNTQHMYTCLWENISRKNEHSVNDIPRL